MLVEKEIGMPDLLLKILEKVAVIKGLTTSELENRLWQNWLNFLGNIEILIWIKDVGQLRKKGITVRRGTCCCWISVRIPYYGLCAQGSVSGHWSCD